MGLQSTEISPMRKKKSPRSPQDESVRLADKIDPQKTDLPRRINGSGGEIKCALVESACARFLAPDARSENAVKHVLLEPANDWVFLEQIKNRGMAFQNLRTVFFRGKKLRHVTFTVAHFGQPLRAFDSVLAFRLCFKCRCALHKNIIKELFRRVRSVNVANGSEQLERKLIALGRERVVASSGQPIIQLRLGQFLRA